MCACSGIRTTGRSSTEMGDDQADKVVAWRYVQLQALGFEPDVALQLASDREVDIHEAADLVNRGCPPATAVRILT